MILLHHGVRWAILANANLEGFSKCNNWWTDDQYGKLF